MVDVFISYSSIDQDFARQLHASLRDRNISTWMMYKDIPPGSIWLDQVDQGLKDCKAVILIVSSASMQSVQIAKEWHECLRQEKPLIPIDIEPVAMGKTNYQLNDLQHIYFHQLPFNEAFDRLYVELRRFGIGVHTDQPSSLKYGNLFWLVHDLMELYRWLSSNDVQKEWLDIGFRQSCHHANHLIDSDLKMDRGFVGRLNALRDEATRLQTHEWNTANRRRYATEVRTIFNDMAQFVQKSDPSFDSGPG